MTVTAETNVTVARRFLEALFEPLIDVPAEDTPLLLIWSTPSKRSNFHRLTLEGVEAAARDAVARSDAGENAYFGLGLLGKRPKAGRGKEGDVVAITAAWADVDVAGPEHSRPNLPHGPEHAEALLAEVGPPPSIVVHSGHGLQAYWLLERPWTFTTKAGRVEAKAFTKGWIDALRVKAHLHGWNVDAVGDLSRVFRVAGTMNLKGEPVPVKILRPPDVGRAARHDLPVLQETVHVVLALPAEPAVVPVKVARIAGLKLNAKAEPPSEKFGATLINDLTFRRSWEHKRPDLQDQSLSAYEMSLAMIAALAGWTDQEIANLLIAHRRKYGDAADMAKALEPGTADTPGYVERTIMKARAPSQGAAAAAEIAEAASTADVMPGDEGLLASLSKALGIRVLAWTQLGEDASTATFMLTTRGPGGGERKISMGRGAAVLSQTRFRETLYAEVGVVMSDFKRKAWFDVCRVLARIRVLVENAESEPAERMKIWLRQYLRQVPLHTDKDEAASADEPYKDAGRVHVSAGSLLRFLRLDLAVPGIDEPRIWAGLRLAGFKRKTVRVAVDGKPSSRSMWVGFHPDEESGLFDGNDDPAACVP